MTPEELAGETGSLEIIIDTKKNARVDSRYYDNYLLQINLSLEGETTRKIVDEDAAVADAGTAKQVVFTGMLKDTPPHFLHWTPPWNQFRTIRSVRQN